jgi:hypothetical protein
MSEIYSDFYAKLTEYHNILRRFKNSFPLRIKFCFMPKWYFFISYLFPFFLMSQNINYGQNIHERKIFFDGSDISLSRSPIFSSSVVVFLSHSGIRVADTLYYLNSGTLKWRNPHFLKPGTQLLIRYRVFPKEWETEKTGNVRMIPDSTGSYFISLKTDRASFSMANELRRMEYTGGFMRGLSMGNRQDVVLNSQLNLQLNGEIAPGLILRAAITDEHLPIQAAGNTLQLQEFDKVFLTLEKDHFQFTAGDFEIRRNERRFNNYYKKVQGLMLRFLQPDDTWTTTGSASFSRGQFQRIILEVTEGNQGPYRLTTPTHAAFTVLLAGTEKVYINGKMAVRGTSGDYVIDYNRGEITFTANRLIVRESRVVVEFEYAHTEQNRSLLAFNSQYKTKNTTFFIDGLLQQDSKTGNRFRNLKEQELTLLAQAAPASEKAYLPGWNSAPEFDPARSYYARKDTLLPCGKRDTFFYHVPFTETDKFLVKFSVPASGKGNYKLSANRTGNDRIYEYIAPDAATCEPLGQFEPMVPVDLPRANRILNIGQESKLFEKVTWQTELGFSQNDPNRFSNAGAETQWGWASWNEWRWVFPENQNRSKVLASLSHEYVSNRYNALEPIRQPDFLRDWGLTNQMGKSVVPQSNEQTIKLNLVYDQNEKFKVDYQLEHYLRTGFFRGLRHQTGLLWEHKNTSISGSLNQVSARQYEEKTSFFRPHFSLSHFFNANKKWVLIGRFDGERKVQRKTASSSLHTSSFAFHETELSLKSPVKNSSYFALHLQNRVDFQASEKQLAAAYAARNIKMEGMHTLGKQLKLKQLWQYRNLSLLNEPGTKQLPGGVLLGQIQGDGTFFRGLIRGNALYEKGSGQEPRLEYTYIQVAPGEGTHIWLDSLFNQDGILQQQEMMPAPFPDQADFIRIHTLSNQYLPTRFLHFNQSIFIDPSRYKGKLHPRLSKWQWNSTWRMDRKTLADKGITAFDPFHFTVSDSNLVSLSYQKKNILFLNKGHKKWDFQLGNQEQVQKWLQTIGAEYRGQKETFIKLRWNPVSQWLVRSEIARGTQFQKAERFPEKNYAMNTLKRNLSLQFLPSHAFRTTLTLIHEKGKPSEFSETAGNLDKKEYQGSGIWNAREGQSFQAQFSRIMIKYSGVASAPATFALLQGLQIGENWQWTFQFEKILGRNLRLQCNYQGRKSANGPFFHVGNVQLGATF